MGSITSTQASLQPIPTVTRAKQKATLPSFYKIIRNLCLGMLLLPGYALAKAANFETDICQRREVSHLCRGNEGIPRIRMPQVEGDVLKRFLESEAAKGVKITRETIPASELTPTQKEIHLEKVYKIMMNTKDPCKSQILVARNQTADRVIDGHHRYAACFFKGGQQAAIVISDLKDQIFEKLSRFAGVFSTGFGAG